MSDAEYRYEYPDGAVVYVPTIEDILTLRECEQTDGGPDDWGRAFDNGE